jgi:5-formyltetrahydrofolate cyclo-ligase
MVRNGTGGRRHPISFADAPPDVARSELRRRLRERRRAISGSRRRRANRVILARLLTLAAFRRARHIALYWPADGEVDLRAVAVAARRDGKTLYLPVVGRGGTMSFAPWLHTTKLRPNRFGIPEPRVTRRQRLSASRLDLIVMPLVAFDAQGHRLGMGGGYYDRALATHRRRPLLVGAAFACQEVGRVPARHWDVPLDLVITERGRHACRRSRRQLRPPGAGEIE